MEGPRPTSPLHPTVSAPIRVGTWALWGSETHVWVRTRHGPFTARSAALKSTTTTGSFSEKSAPLSPPAEARLDHYSRDVALAPKAHRATPDADSPGAARQITHRYRLSAPNRASRQREPDMGLPADTRRTRPAHRPPRPPATCSCTAATGSKSSGLVRDRGYQGCARRCPGGPHLVARGNRWRVLRGRRADSHDTRTTPSTTLDREARV